jgi:hypothetical protein
MIPRTGPVAKLRRTGAASARSRRRAGMARARQDLSGFWGEHALDAADDPGRGAGADHLRQPGDRLHRRPRGHRPLQRPADGGRAAAWGTTRRAPAAAGPLERPPQYGRQFEVHSYQTVLPATIQGIRRYLGSGLIKGIGPKMAERIVDHFAETTLQVIEQEPSRLVEVPGLGPKRTAMITAAWQEQQAIKQVMVFLQGVGVSTSLGVRIYKTYRDQAIDVVRREPYRLAGEVWGDRLQDRRHDRPAARHPPRQPAAGQGRPAVCAVAGQRGWPLLPSRCRAAHKGDRAASTPAGLRDLAGQSVIGARERPPPPIPGPDHGPCGLCWFAARILPALATWGGCVKVWECPVHGVGNYLAHVPAAAHSPRWGGWWCPARRGDSDESPPIRVAGS